MENGRENPAEKKPVPMRRTKTEKSVHRNSRVRGNVIQSGYPAEADVVSKESEATTTCRQDHRGEDVQQILLQCYERVCQSVVQMNRELDKLSEETNSPIIDNLVESIENHFALALIAIENNQKGEEKEETVIVEEFREGCEDQDPKASSAEGGISLIVSENDDDYDDNGYENPRYYYKTDSRETYFDENFNPRIEKISCLNSCDVQATGKLATSLSVPSSPSGMKNKIDYVIEELITTEERYVQNLRKIKKNYIAYLSDDKLLDYPDIIGKQRYLFGNIEEILVQSENFLITLKDCRGNYELIAVTFVAYDIMFELYPDYSKNKLRADNYYEHIKKLINERQKELGERLDLASYLMAPIQRLGKYNMLLENMQKELSRQDIVSENLDSAIAIVKSTMRKMNDFLAVDSIKNCPVSLVNQAGSYITREKFTILKPQKFESVVFLFEKIVVLTEMLANSTDFFAYVDHIFLKDLTIVTFEEEALMFHLIDYIKCKENRQQNTHVLEATSLEVKQRFTSQIQTKLWEQLHKVREKVKELHNTNCRSKSMQEIKEKKMGQARKHCESMRIPAGDKMSQSTFYV